MEELIKLVQEWANNKGLNKPEQFKAQALKVIEEMGEMNAALLRINKEGERFIQMPKLIDGLGDLQVTLIVLCLMQRPSSLIPKKYPSINYSEIEPADIDYRINDFDYMEWAIFCFKKFSSMLSNSTDIDSFSNNLSYLKRGISEICGIFNLTTEQCLAAAYDEIKGRTGTLVNGTFIKDEVTPQVVDLSELKEGDSVEFKNGTFDKIERVQKCDADWDYKIYFSDETVCMYMQDGRVLRSEEPRRAAWNIVRIIKA